MSRFTLAASTFLLASLAGTAAAAPVTVADLSGGGATWQNIVDGDEGFMVADARVGGNGDAFDYGLTFQIGGLKYLSGGSFDLNGQTATGNTAVLAGLNVFVQYYADTGSPTLRTLISLSNTGTSAVATTVRMQTNNGSDGSTQTVATSSGDLGFTSADRWIITDDSTISGDPTNTHVLWGNGGQAPANVGLTVFDAAGVQGVLANFALDIAAGQTQSLMFFNQIHTTALLAQGRTATFDNLGSSNTLLAGLSNNQLAQIQNWDFDVQTVPEPGVIALLGLGLAGWGVSRRASKARGAVRQTQ